MQPKPPAQARRLPNDWKTNPNFRTHRELVQHLQDDVDTLRSLALACTGFGDLTRPYRLRSVKFDVWTRHHQVRVRDDVSGQIKVQNRATLVSPDMQDLAAAGNLKRYVEELTVTGDVDYTPQPRGQGTRSIYPSPISQTSQNATFRLLESLLTEFQSVRRLTLERLPVHSKLLMALHGHPNLETVTLRSVVFHGAFNDAVHKPIPVRCLEVSSVFSAPTISNPYTKQMGITDVFDLDTLDEYILDYSGLDKHLASYAVCALPKTIYRAGARKCALSAFSCIADSDNILTICKFLASPTALTITDLTLLLSNELTPSESIRVINSVRLTMTSPLSLQFLETLRCRYEIAYGFVPGRHISNLSLVLPRNRALVSAEIHLLSGLLQSSEARIEELNIDNVNVHNYREYGAWGVK